METSSCIVANHHQQGGAATAGGRCHGHTVTRQWRSQGHGVKGQTHHDGNSKRSRLFSNLMVGDGRRRQRGNHTGSVTGHMTKLRPPFFTATSIKEQWKKKRFQPEVWGISIGVSIGFSIGV